MSRPARRTLALIGSLAVACLSAACDGPTAPGTLAHSDVVGASRGAQDGVPAGALVLRTAEEQALPATGTEGIYESSHPAGRELLMAAPTGVMTGTVPDPTSPPLVRPRSDEVEPRPIGEGRVDDADVVRVEGDRIYALSQLGGLNVIDAANPDAMSVLGRFHFPATPLELHVRDGIATVVYNAYLDVEGDDAAGTFESFNTSVVVVVDATSPDSIGELGRYRVPGHVSESFVAGDVLYVVAHETDACWGCVDGPRTKLVSIDLADPAAIAALDELSLPDVAGWPRAVERTDDLLFLTGPNRTDAEPTASMLHVVDISDPAGGMTLGASLEVAGSLTQRWQLDAFDGALRVVSLPLPAEAGVAPRIDTFTATSADALTLVGSAELDFSTPDRVVAARFDGPRAYVWGEQAGPAAAIDLGDPAAPRAASLPSEGLARHVEPRGDRAIVVTLLDGKHALSLFDVTDVDAPALLSRIDLGEWGTSRTHDQRRGVTVLEEHGPIAVPVSRTTAGSTSSTCASATTLWGLQMVDWEGDALALGSLVPTTNLARRELGVAGRVVSLNDHHLTVSNIDDGATTRRLELQIGAGAVSVLGDAVTRVAFPPNADYVATVTTRADVDDANAGSTTSLAPLFPSCSRGASVATVGDQVVMPYFSEAARPNLGVSHFLGSFDPSTGAVVGQVKVGDFHPSLKPLTYGLVDPAPDALPHGSSWVTTHYRANRALHVVNVSNPTAPSLASLELPEARGNTGLLASGNTLATSQFLLSPTAAHKVRFFLERIDLSDPARPERMPSVSIPGSLLAYDEASQHAVTLDYTAEVQPATQSECMGEAYKSWRPTAGEGGSVLHEDSIGECYWVHQTVRLIAITNDRAAILDSHEIEFPQRVMTAAAGDDRLFVALGESTGEGLPGGAIISLGMGFYEYFNYAHAVRPLRVFGGVAGERLSVRDVDVPGSLYYRTELLARGQRAVVSWGDRRSAFIVDAANVEAPTVEPVELLGGVGRNVARLSLSGDTIVGRVDGAGIQLLSLGD